MALHTMTCRRCRGTWQEQHTTGAYPSVCPTCDPAAATARAQRRGKPSSYQLLREERDVLRARCTELEATLRVAHEQAAGEPGRAAVVRAVRDLGHAEGRVATRRALRALAAQALRWAAVLDAKADAAMELRAREPDVDATTAQPSTGTHAPHLAVLPSPDHWQRGAQAA